MERLVAHGRELGAAVLRVEPELEDSLAARDLLARLGFRQSRETVQPPSTIQVDLTGGDDAILARMKSKWRYNIRLAERKGRPGARRDAGRPGRLQRTHGGDGRRAMGLRCTVPRIMPRPSNC